MISSNPLISVILTTYNSEKFVEESIRSVIDQTYPNFEIIIVDDQSTDKTGELVKKFTEKDNRIKFFSIPHTGKPAAVRNYGFKVSKGDLIAFLDGDDVWEKNKLNEQIKALKENSEAVLTYSVSVTFGNVNIFSPFYEVLPLPFKTAKTKNDLIQKGGTIPLSTVLIKREYFKRAHGFDEDPQLKVEDYDLWLRLGDFGNFLFVPRIHTYYRIHSNQFSADWESKRTRLEYLAEKRNLKLPQYKFYRNRGFFFLMVRNAVHLLSYFWFRSLGIISKIFNEKR